MTSPTIQILDVNLLLIGHFKYDIISDPNTGCILVADFFVVSNVTSDATQILDVGLSRIGRFKYDVTCYPNTGCTVGV